MRREFTRAVRVEVAKRSLVNGIPTCEWIDPETGVRCACAKRLDLHHDNGDAFHVDKSRKLTASDGRLLCKRHHNPITARQQADLSRVKAAEARHLGARKPKAPIPQPPKAPKSSAKLDSIRALGGAGLSRQGFEPIGDVAARVLAKITPRKDAAE